MFYNATCRFVCATCLFLVISCSGRTYVANSPAGNSNVSIVQPTPSAQFVTGSGTSIEAIVNNTTLCLTSPDGATNGTPVVLAACDANNINQRWTLGPGQIKNSNNQCLDWADYSNPSNPNYAFGNKMILYACVSNQFAGSQSFAYKYGALISLYHSIGFSVPDANNNVDIQKNPYYLWNFGLAFGGTMISDNQGPQAQCIDGNIANNTVLLSDCTGSDDQLWSIKNTLLFHKSNPSMCLGQYSSQPNSLTWGDCNSSVFWYAGSVSSDIRFGDDNVLSAPNLDLPAPSIPPAVQPDQTWLIGPMLMQNK